jgi:hypothetical protein
LGGQELLRWLELIVGLEAVEFIQGIESALGISIPDADADAIVTPRALVDYLKDRLARERANQQSSSEDLEKLVRRLLVHVCEHEGFTLDTEFRKIFP